MYKKLKHISRKIVLPSLYKKYVKEREEIKEDIHQTLIIRGSKAVQKPIERQFYHLMHYYPEFAFIFFWRIKKQKYRWRNLFLKNFNCKIFGGTKIEGGLMVIIPSP